MRTMLSDFLIACPEYEPTVAGLSTIDRTHR